MEPVTMIMVYPDGHTKAFVPQNQRCSSCDNKTFMKELDSRWVIGCQKCGTRTYTLKREVKYDYN